jgi:hypothetical protein
MTLRHISDLKAPIGEVIEAAGGDGILLEPEGRPAYAMMPLDDHLLDYLLERNPRLIEECARIRQRMRQGEFHSHDEVKRMLRG